MPAIQSIPPHESIVGTSRERIQELKARATESLDDAMTAVTRNLGRREAAEAEANLDALGLDLAGKGSAAHSLDHARVLDLISDPFEED
ncbi:hypothetical protein LF599_16675 [Pseudodesulfovibrio thermohalotolerans]|uniref:hypothetical protein n=1 Tax=Pseudodesulfovibrio thermohalotolerans TaxID=2880651 RepID=UPI002441688E|nr:hypothetical protein [Pseudodesulfovibrio thermohalotolerans]WFS62275.1 hypothetical protein LF599_16675 [Pseudodesulfovibrio thermohalotolerans]